MQTTSGARWSSHGSSRGSRERAELTFQVARRTAATLPTSVAGMSLVAGVDSSTQSCTIVIRDATTGEHVRSGRAPHPLGTEVDPAGWWDALQAALAQAGGLSDVDAIAVAGQQHGMVCLDAAGEVVRPALLWNDTRSAGAAD